MTRAAPGANGRERRYEPDGTVRCARCGDHEGVTCERGGRRLCGACMGVVRFLGGRGVIVEDVVRMGESGGGGRSESMGWGERTLARDLGACAFTKRRTCDESEIEEAMR